MCEHTAPKEQSQWGDCLRSERRCARRQSRAEGKLPATHQLRWRGRGKLATNTGETLNLRQHVRAAEQQHTDRHNKEQLILLREIAGGRQSAARLVAVARTGNGLGMFFRAAILFFRQSRRINQAARNRWQPDERQHQRDHCLDTLHEESNTTAAWPKQSGRLGYRPKRKQPGTRAPGKQSEELQ